MAESAKEGGDPKDALDTELARFEAEMAELTTTPPPPPPAPLPPPKAASSKPRPPMPPPPPAGASKTPPPNGSVPARPPPPPPSSLSGPPSQISSPPVPSGARPPPPSFPGAQPGPPRTPPGPPPAGFRPPPPPAQWSAPPTFPPPQLYGPTLRPPSVAPLPAPLPAPGPQPFYPPGPSGQFAPPGQYPPVLAQYPGPVAAPPLTQGQTLFERDMKALDPAELERVKAALAGEEPKPDPKKETKKRPIARTAAGEKWVDPTLAEWPENDFRLFCGNLGNEVNEDVLSKAFVKYSSFNMAKVIRDKRTGKTRGYGFVSFATQGDMFSALKEMQGKYVGNRPLILRKSSWEERTDAEAQKKKYKKQKSKHVG